MEFLEEKFGKNTNYKKTKKEMSNEETFTNAFDSFAKNMLFLFLEMSFLLAIVFFVIY